MRAAHVLRRMLRAPLTASISISDFNCIAAAAAVVSAGMQ